MKKGKAKNSFKILEKSNEKRVDYSGNFTVDETTIKGLGDFVRVPAEAFDPIRNKYSHFAHLKNGLWVAKKKLQNDDYNRFCFTVHQDKITIIGGKKNGAISVRHWNAAKDITRMIGGRMMTPSEYFCATDWVKSAYSEDMLESLTLSKSEWLDAAVIDRSESKDKNPQRDLEGYVSLFSTSHSNCHTGGLEGYTPLLKDTSGHFNIGDVDLSVGFPKKLIQGNVMNDHKRMWYHYQCPLTRTSGDMMAVMRGVKFYGRDMPELTLFPYAVNALIAGIRLCFEADMHGDPVKEPYRTRASFGSWGPHDLKELKKRSGL